MARTVQHSELGTRSARLRLAPRKKPYFRLLEHGKHLGYYRGARGGTWLARLNKGGRYVEARLGPADDTSDANGIDVLTFAQAQEKARDWFDAQARSTSGSQVGPYTVAQACDDYLADYMRRSGKDEANTKGRLDRIKAAFGQTEVNGITAAQIRKWHSAIADGNPLTRSKKVDEVTGDRQRREIDRTDPDARRRRKASANRLLSVLKAVLNQAFRHPPEGVRVHSRAAWEAVNPYKGADAPKIRYLTDEEARRLLNACETDFRQLVAAALLTGCRYGELCRLRVTDFDAQSKMLRVETSKSGKPRSVALTDEGAELFKHLSLGMQSNDLLLTRSDGEPWASSHQLRRMDEASIAAKISPAVSFHILRHTYASRLAMKGAPMAVIAAQLGHSDTRMTERHYAHLGPSYVADTVRALFDSYGMVAEPSNVVAIADAKKI